ncbi:hypothetical protein ACQR1W_13390 [Bradyrhizobium sp. HKCCYLS1011]|uniref:hypothetical protein n=1 Tax=Bradyrhizobium sp. HKCCYLS1011 TaxID=3420733 RepID=UPI003EBF8A93
MKLFVGAVSAALIAAAAAQAEPLAPSYRAVSDFDGPYADQPLPPAPVPPPAPRYGYGPGPDYGYQPEDRYPPPRQYRPEGYAPDYGYAPAFLPVHEVYAILRDHGFSPLGAPRQRGNVYVIAVLDRDGEDGKIVIDAVSGRIVRFVPAFQWGNEYERMRYAPPRGQIDNLPPPTVIRADPRIVPPAPVEPRLASRAAPAPLPRVAAPAVRPAAPAQTAALNPRPAEAKPVESRPAPQTTATIAQPQPPAAEQKPAPQTTASVTSQRPVIEQKPAPQVLPTQAMPPVQALE